VTLCHLGQYAIGSVRALRAPTGWWFDENWLNAPRQTSATNL
jgi:hypothetical protein